MEVESYEHGVPCWIDLGTPDIKKASDFYGALFGWQVFDAGPDAGGYHMAYLRDRPVAGLGPQQNPGPPYWTTYIKCDDADKVVGLAEQAGGMVFVPPMDVLEVGRMAIAADPAGAAFGMWQPKEHKGAGLVNEPGTLCWNELMTTDVEGAKKFYGDVFGWAAQTHGEGPMGGYTEFQVGGRSIAGCMEKPPEVPAEVPPNWGIYFATDDTDASVAQATKLGGTVLMPPMDIEPGRFSTLMDPTGAMFSVLTLKETA